MPECDQQVNVIRHEDEIVQPEYVFCPQSLEQAEQEFAVLIDLKDAPPLKRGERQEVSPRTAGARA